MAGSTQAIETLRRLKNLGYRHLWLSEVSLEGILGKIQNHPETFANSLGGVVVQGIRSCFKRDYQFPFGLVEAFIPETELHSAVNQALAFFSGELGEMTLGDSVFYHCVYSYTQGFKPYQKAIFALERQLFVKTCNLLGTPLRITKTDSQYGTLQFDMSRYKGIESLRDTRGTGTLYVEWEHVTLVGHDEDPTSIYSDRYYNLYGCENTIHEARRNACGNTAIQLTSYAHELSQMLDFSSDTEYEDEVSASRDRILSSAISNQSVGALFYGSTGTGKTWLVYRIAQILSEVHNFTVVVTNLETAFKIGRLNIPRLILVVNELEKQLDFEGLANLLDLIGASDRAVKENGGKQQRIVLFTANLMDEILSDERFAPLFRDGRVSIVQQVQRQQTTVISDLAVQKVRETPTQHLALAS